MSGLWRNVFGLWRLSIGVFGVVLSAGAFEATSGPIRLLLSILGGAPVEAFDPTLRFSLAVMGAVTIGWAVTLHYVIRAAIDLGAQGRPLWNAVTAGVVSWYVIDSLLSAATGFGLNIIPNTVIAATYAVALVGSGVLKPQA